MSAAAIAKALGGYASTSGWHRSRCPVHGGTSWTLSLRDGASGLVVKCFAGCSRADILDELENLFVLEEDEEKDLSAAVAATGWQEVDAVQRQLRIDNALYLWNETVDPAGTAVEVYLWSRRLYVPLPLTIRLHRSLYHRESGERRPAMVALVEHADRGPVAIHCTYLAPDGSAKATVSPSRKCFGPVGGGGVMLRTGPPDGWLVVGEGVESTLSAMQMWHCPEGLAAVSANGMRDAKLPPSADRVCIAVDNDANGIGQAAARDAVWLWEQEGRTVRAVLPKEQDSDFNDILRRF